MARESRRWRHRHLPLLRIIWPFVAVVVLLTLLGNVSLYVMSSVRAYVSGESLWSKAQKAAVGHLIEYAYTRDEADYRRYVGAIAVALGDRRARVGREAGPDHVARAGFLAGGNHPEDIDGMIDLFRRLRHVPFMAKAIAIWADGDEHIAELDSVAARMHAAIAAGSADAATLRPQLERVRDIDAWLTPIEKEFSATLGVASGRPECGVAASPSPWPWCCSRWSARCAWSGSAKRSSRAVHGAGSRAGHVGGHCRRGDHHRHAGGIEY
jgi:hypothetical protein